MTAGLPRVLVVYQHLPHYRYGVFTALQERRTASYEFAADVTSRSRTIPTISPTDLGVFHRLRNHWFGPILWQRGLLRLVWTGHFDAVVFLGDVAYASTWVAAVVGRLRGATVLFWTIGWHRDEAGLKKHARLVFYRLAHQLLLYGNVARAIGERLGYPAERITVVGNSVGAPPASVATAPASVETFDPTNLPTDGHLVTAVVRLNRAKSLDLLVRAVGAMDARPRPVRVLLVGDGPERGFLEDLARELTVDVTFAGSVYSPDVIATVYERASVTVVPTNAGLTSIQSMRHGRPVITGDDPFRQAPESECIRAGLTGDFYRSGSIASLAETIGSWLDRMESDREGVAARCREEYEQHWSPEAHAQAIDVAVGELLDATSRGPSLSSR